MNVSRLACLMIIAFEALASIAGAQTGLWYPDQPFTSAGEFRSRDSYHRSGTSIVLAQRHVFKFDVETGDAPVLTNYVRDSYSYTVAVLDPAELGDLGGFSRSEADIQYAQGQTAPAIMYAGLPQHTVVPIHIASDDVLAGQQITVVIRLQATFHDDQGSVTWDKYAARDLDVAKLLCDDASIDTRKMFGQPNADGTPGTDPNAPYRPINFGHWDYKGGLFVGVMTGQYNRDQSGTARIQLWVGSGGQGTFNLAVLSLLYKGKPSSQSVQDSSDLALFIPNSNDPNLSTTETTTTWANRWDIDPATMSPLCYANFNFSQPEYLNFTLNSGPGSVPSMALQKLCITHRYESTLSQAAWSYFGSKEYLDVPSISFPDTDCRPRVWRVGVAAERTWG